ncbi:hypothetical protein [Helicobacter suis]|uniref:hypothetical protein n=1 Tax=Helicobacter suis TaxID=104628 RepID=UPI000CF0493B|nr:hypothetical protein [Helicobacter suis]
MQHLEQQELEALINMGKIIGVFFVLGVGGAVAQNLFIVQESKIGKAKSPQELEKARARLGIAYVVKCPNAKDIWAS